MTDETTDIMDTLAFTIGLILKSDERDRHRIALAYQEAQTLVASIPLDNGDARPRITACFEHYETYRAADDIAAAGWMLTAIETRLRERNLEGGDLLIPAVERALEMLPRLSTARHGGAFASGPARLSPRPARPDSAHGAGSARSRQRLALAARQPPAPRPHQERHRHRKAGLHDRPKRPAPCAERQPHVGLPVPG